MTRPTPFVLVLMTFTLLLAGCGDDQAKSGDRLLADAEGKAKDPVSDHPAPPADWSLPVIDAAGYAALREQAAADGKVLVIDHWATWCGTCKAMFPLLHEAMARRGDKVVLVSMSHDENAPGGTDYLALAEQYLIEQHAWEHAYVVDPSAKDAIAKATSGKWDGGTLPAVFVFGPDGKRVFELDELRGEPADWVATIAAAVDRAGAESPGQ